jgi:hypothetical protein
VTDRPAPLRSVDPEAFVLSLLQEAAAHTWHGDDAERVLALLRRVEGYLLPDKALGRTFVHTTACALAAGLPACTCGARPQENQP